MRKPDRNLRQIPVRPGISLLFLSLLFLPAGCAESPTTIHTTVIYQTQGADEAASHMSMAEAMEKIRAVLKTANGPLTGIKVARYGFSYGTPNVLKFKYNDVQDLTIKQSYGEYLPMVYEIQWGSVTSFYWESRDDAETFVHAVMSMKYYDSLPYVKQQLSDFQEKAKSWLSLPQKPQLSKEARRFRVLADDALAEKDFDKAADCYEQGLEIEPIWPQGQYNAAVIYAELKDYARAVMHMKEYLLLMPDAKDAQAVQDKIDVWEEKAKAE